MLQAVSCTDSACAFSNLSFVIIYIGMTAPQAAGVIHSDFEKGFIRAETVSRMKKFWFLLEKCLSYPFCLSINFSLYLQVYTLFCIILISLPILLGVATNNK